MENVSEELLGGGISDEKTEYSLTERVIKWVLVFCVLVGLASIFLIPFFVLTWLIKLCFA